MSLSHSKELSEVAKNLCRELRKNSTNAEKIFWEKIRNRQLNSLKFYRQYPIFYDLEGPESFFIADFYCRELRLIIELDGSIHKYKLKKDQERTFILNKLGLYVLRFTNKEIELDMNSVLNKVIEFVKK